MIKTKKNLTISSTSLSFLSFRKKILEKKRFINYLIFLEVSLFSIPFFQPLFDTFICIIRLTLLRILANVKLIAYIQPTVNKSTRIHLNNKLKINTDNIKLKNLVKGETQQSDNCFIYLFPKEAKSSNFQYFFFLSA